MGYKALGSIYIRSIDIMKMNQDEEGSLAGLIVRMCLSITTIVDEFAPAN